MAMCKAELRFDPHAGILHSELITDGVKTRKAWSFPGCVPTEGAEWSILPTVTSQPDRAAGPGAATSDPDSNRVGVGARAAIFLAGLCVLALGAAAFVRFRR
jgi:hypothetical protein